MGDNRGLSQDSRCQGTIPIDKVIGRAFLRVWPPSHWGGIGTPDYPGVPAATAGATPVSMPDPASTILALTLVATPLSAPRWRSRRRARRTVRVTDKCASRVRCVRD
jgi:signal peptidase I